MRSFHLLYILSVTTLGVGLFVLVGVVYFVVAVVVVVVVVTLSVDPIVLIGGVVADVLLKVEPLSSMLVGSMIMDVGVTVYKLNLSLGKVLYDLCYVDPVLFSCADRGVDGGGCEMTGDGSKELVGDECSVEKSV